MDPDPEPDPDPDPLVRGDPHQNVMDPQQSTLHLGIHLSCWIRIHIFNADPDPDLGGKKWPTNIEKKLRIFMFWSVDVLFWGLKASSVACASFLCLLPSPGNVLYLFWRQFIVITAVISTANSVKQEGVQCRHYSVLYFLASCLSKNWARDPFEASIASYGSQNFF